MVYETPFAAEITRTTSSSSLSMRGVAPGRPTPGLVVRAGVPQIYGALVAAAAEADIPVMFSANAFAVTKDGEFQRFNLSAARKLPTTLRAALDSAGFVAMARYGGYRWTESDYMSLVAAREGGWDFWSSMDMCCEPPVAGALVTKEIRIEATALGYIRGCRLAREWGVKPPLPVIQGWFPEDYVRCAQMMEVEEWPDLVGLGSVCRRNIYGPDGIAAVIEALDKVLPPTTKLHCFGVKGGAVKALGAHPRFASLDSMAWDFGVRADQRTGRTQAMRIERMLGWQAAQDAVVPDLYASPAQQELQLTFGDEEDRVPELPEAIVHRAVAAWYGDHLLGDHGYREVAAMALEEARLIVHTLNAFGHEPLAESTDMAQIAAYDALQDAGHVPARVREHTHERA